MNDPGLDQPAQQAAQDVERDAYEEDKKQMEWEEQDYLDPRCVACSLVRAVEHTDASIVDGGSLLLPVRLLRGPSGLLRTLSASALLLRNGECIFLLAQMKATAQGLRIRNGTPVAPTSGTTRPAG